MATSFTLQNSLNLPDDINDWLEIFDQSEEPSENGDISAGGLLPAEAKAAYDHERKVYEMVKSAAKRVAAETCSAVFVIRPKQPHTHSINGYSIKPDFLVTIKGTDTKCTAVVVDAKNHKGYIAPSQWRKADRDMGEVKV